MNISTKISGERCILPKVGQWVTRRILSHKSDVPCELFSFNPARMNNYIHHKMWDEITYPFPEFNGHTVEVWKETSSTTLLGMWLLIHSGIEVKGDGDSRFPLFSVTWIMDPWVSLWGMSWLTDLTMQVTIALWHSLSLSFSLSSPMLFVSFSDQWYCIFQCVY